jgi:hypothetical protein
MEGDGRRRSVARMAGSPAFDGNLIARRFINECAGRAARPRYFVEPYNIANECWPMIVFPLPGRFFVKLKDETRRHREQD